MLESIGSWSWHLSSISITSVMQMKIFDSPPNGTIILCWLAFSKYWYSYCWLQGQSKISNLSWVKVQTRDPVDGRQGSPKQFQPFHLYLTLSSPENIKWHIAKFSQLNLILLNKQFRRISLFILQKNILPNEILNYSHYQMFHFVWGM